MKKYMFLPIWVSILFLGLNTIVGQTIKLVYQPKFYTYFDEGEYWEDLNPESVKSAILNLVTADFSPYNINVSPYLSDLEVRIGETGAGYGFASTGIGSYFGGGAYAEVYTDKFVQYPTLQYGNATVSRVSNSLAGTISHEAGHLLNVFHDYMYDAYDPTISGALNSNYEPIGVDFVPEGCKDYTYSGHLMASTGFISDEDRAIRDRSFSNHSGAVLNFSKNRGGSINRNFVWGLGNSSFSQLTDISISAGTTFIISDAGYNHQLNGHHIFGGIIENHGSVSPSNIILKNGTVTKGYFSDINDALNHASTGEVIEIYNSFSLNTEFVVTTGITLKIKSGSNFDLNGYKLLQSGGSIIVESGGDINSLAQLKSSSNVLLGYYPTIQSAIDDAQYGYTVELKSMTYTENLTLTSKNGVKLLGAGVGNTTVNSNITLTNSTYAVVSDFSMGNGKTITVNGGYSPNISSISSTSGSSAINVYDGTATEISNSNYISDDAQVPAWSFYNTNSSGLMSDVIEGYMFGIYANSGSDISLNAPLFCNNMIDLYANGSTTSIYAREYVLSYEGATIGNVTLADGNDPCGSGGMFKSNIPQNEQVVNDNLREANSAFRALLSDEDISKSFTLTEKGKNKIKAVITKYKNALLINLSQSEINEALRKLSACYKMLDEVTVFAGYVSSLVSNKSVSKEMKRFLISSIVSKGDYNEAINLINEILTYKEISIDLEYELLYEKGTIQKYYLEEKTLSEEVFLNLYKKAGEHILAHFAKAQLDNQSGLDDGNNEIDKDNSESNDNFSISSFPNPFNPTTTIAYQIPYDGFVNLVIYNSLGQVVSTLVNKNQTSGKYSVQFNASNLPSGVYFYKMKSGRFTKVSKMLLLR